MKIQLAGSRSFIGFSIAAILAAAAMSPSIYCRADETHDRVAYFIEQLASTNMEPSRTGEEGEWEIRFPVTYDQRRQVAVYTAIQQLLTEGEAAIEQLAASMGDPRYSFSMDAYSSYNVSVGHACGLLITRQILCFEPEMRNISRDQWLDRPGKQDWAEWWQKNRRHGLAALQINAIDRQIDKLQALDASTAKAWHAQADRLTVEEFNKGRDTNIRVLKGIRSAIIATNKAYRPTALETEGRAISGIPWGAKSFNR